MTGNSSRQRWRQSNQSSLTEFGRSRQAEPVWQRPDGDAVVERNAGLEESAPLPWGFQFRRLACFPHRWLRKPGPLRLGMHDRWFAHQRGDGGADLYIIPTGSPSVENNARVRRTVRRHLAGLVFVAVQAVDADRVERLQISLPHSGEGQPIEPRVVGDEADHALAGLLRDAPFGHAEETDVKVNQPLAFMKPYIAVFR